MDALYAALAYAQLGRAADTERWRARLLAAGPDFSGERFRQHNGDFVLPQAASERTLWLDSLAKARLPTSASREQLATSPAAGPMPECEAERPEATAKTL